MSTISGAIIKDHRKLAEYYHKIINSTDDDDQQRFGNQFTRELARHLVAEDLVVHPAFKKYLDDRGQEMARGDRIDHHEIKKLIKSFQNMKPEDPDYISRIEGVWAMFTQHILDEEEIHLPMLEDALKSEGNTSESLAKKFQTTKTFAPSRSHPFAGESRRTETIVLFFNALVDRLADIFRKYPEDTQ